MRSVFLRRVVNLVLSAALLGALTIPTSAFFRKKKADAPALTDSTRNVLIGGTLSFSTDDFSVSDDESLSSITITALPDRGCGVLSVGTQPLEQGSIVRSTALDGLRFQAMNAPTAERTAFSFSPTFSSGKHP